MLDILVSFCLLSGEPQKGVSELKSAPSQAAKQDAFPEFAEIKKSYEQWQNSLSQEFNQAKTEEEKDAAFEKIIVAVEKTGRPHAVKALNLVKQKPSDPQAVPILLWILQGFLETSTAGEAVDLLIKYHLPDMQLHQSLGRWICQPAEPNIRLLRAIIASDLPAETRGIAKYWLAEALEKIAELPERMKHEDQKQRKKQEQFFGAASYQFLYNYPVETAAKEAEALYEEITKYPVEIKYGDNNTYNKLAANRLYVMRHLAIGKPALEIAGEDLDGKPMKLSDFRGKVVVLTFCGYWCGPCVNMIPHERELVKRLENKPFVLLTVNSDQDRQKAREQTKHYQVTWNSWWDGGSTSGPISQAWKIRKWPTIYVLDQHGIIRAQEVRGKPLDKVVDELLKEMEQKK